MRSINNEHLARHSDLVPMPILDTPITIVGAGAIGSFLTLQLAKMGFEDITVWDFDVVEVENLGSQFYRFFDVNMPKVDALGKLVFDFTEVAIKGKKARFTLGTKCDSKIMIAAVDSMKSRSDLFKSCKSSWFIDPRMGAMDAALYVVDMGNESELKNYQTTLVSDGAAVQERCTAKATIFTANMLSGLVAKCVVDCLTGHALKSAEWSIKHNDFIAHGGS